MDNPVAVGRFGKTHGIQGWLRIQSFTKPLDNLLNYDHWHIQQQGQWQELEVKDSKLHSDDLLVLIKGIDSPEMAKEKLTGKIIHISREQLPSLADDEVYWSDLEGLTVINLAEQTLGQVDYMMDCPGNPVMIVKGERERLIPFVRKQFIKHIDLQKQQIIVDWDADF